MAKSGHITSDVVLKAANKFISFINKAPSPFHAVDEIKQTLNGAGFKELKETDKWDVKPLDKYYVTRNLSTIIAFAVGGQYAPGNGFTVIGTHTDSPCLKVKPVSKVTKAEYLQVGVELYGGGIWMTWFDRDLTIAGRVIVKDGDKLKQRLIHVKRPVLRVPTLAIHLDREVNNKFSPNKETHVCPVLATSAADQLTAPTPSGQPSDQPSGQPSSNQESDRHHSVLIKLICDELNVTADHIVDLELCLADTQPAAIGGAVNEFIFSPRLDNLLSSFSAAEAMVETSANLDSETNIRMISLFDNEEVGSKSAQGAESTLQELVMRRISHSLTNPLSFEEAIPKSMMLSADCAHAIHPNYTDKHEGNHQPSLHGGIVVKSNVNQRYATTAVTRSIVRTIADKANVPLQNFVVRNDMACGSTIGPIMSAKLGIPTADVGAPMLSMHSVREMCGVTSVHYNNQLFAAFLQNFPEVRDKLV